MKTKDEDKRGPTNGGLLKSYRDIVEFGGGLTNICTMHWRDTYKIILQYLIT